VAALDSSAFAVGTVVAVAVLLAANAALIAVVVARRGWLVARARITRDVSRRLRAELPTVLSADSAVPDVEAIVRSVRRRDRPIAGHVVLQLTRELPEDDLERLRVRLRAGGAVMLAQEGLRRRQPWRRALGCHVLGALRAEEAVPLLAALGADRVREVRVAAARALGEIGTPHAASVLGRWYVAREAVSTTVAYEALCACGSAATPFFVEASVAADAPLRASACFGLSQIATEGELPRVRAVLGSVLATDADVDVRAAAADALGDLGGRVVPQVLVRAAGSSDLPVRRAAVRALGSFDDAGSVPLLNDLLGHDDRETALRAADALFALRARGHATAAVVKSLAETDSWAVEQAAVAAT
jgi:hypothetical protein